MTTTHPNPVIATIEAAEAKVKAWHQEAYATGQDDSHNGHDAQFDYSEDWSIQQEYLNGFHGRPYWY